MAASAASASKQNTPAQTRLLNAWARRLEGLAKLRRAPQLGKLTITGRLADGTITFRAIPGWEIGRTHQGTFIPGPARSFTYALHPSGRICGHGYKDCGCGHGAEETTAAQTAWNAGGKQDYARKLKPAQRDARGIKLAAQKKTAEKTTTRARKQKRAEKTAQQATA